MRVRHGCVLEFSVDQHRILNFKPFDIHITRQLANLNSQG